MSKLNEIVWKDRYDITCPSCAHEMQCAPCMFHQMGFFEMGGGTCPECKTMMEIHFYPVTNSMVAYEYKYPVIEEDDCES